MKYAYYLIPTQFTGRGHATKFILRKHIIDNRTTFCKRYKQYMLDENYCGGPCSIIQAIKNRAKYGLSIKYFPYGEVITLLNCENPYYFNKKLSELYL